MRVLAICIAVMALTAVSVAAQNPPTPVIPLQWQAGHVTVSWNVNQTAALEFAGQQYWDYTQDMLREDFSMSGASFVTFNQYSTQKTYQIVVGTWAGNVPSCSVTPLNGDQLPDRYLFANATYSGKQQCNGQTQCDVWWVVAPNPTAGQAALNTTIWWDTARNQPVTWTSAAVDGSSFTEVSLFNFQPNVNVPGTGLFSIPTPLCADVGTIVNANAIKPPAAILRPKW